MPSAIQPVQSFELDRYLGTWYEIARLDHSFERGLSNVTAEYRLRDDGGVMVLNRGFSAETQAWKEAEGRAYFVNDPSEGYLKVSFFGPFFGSYVVFELDQADYGYAFVSGPNKDFLWLLARTPEIDDEVREKFEALALKHGFDLTDLVYVTHDSP